MLLSFTAFLILINEHTAGFEKKYVAESPKEVLGDNSETTYDTSEVQTTNTTKPSKPSAPSSEPAAASQPTTTLTKPRKFEPTITEPTYIPLPGEHVGLDPYTCYTYNWSENWWIAYRYDVTPHADGTKTVSYGGGAGSNTKRPEPMPDMCLFNLPPSTTPGNPPFPGGIFPDTSYH